MPSPVALDPARGQASREIGAWATHAALFVVQLAFASQAVEGKIAMAPRASGGEAVAPHALAMARMLGAALVFQIAMRALGRVRKTVWRDQAQLAVLSVLGIALNQTLYLVGLRLTTPMAATLLGVTIPVFAAGLAVAIGQERGSARLALGIALAMSGVIGLVGIHSVDRGAVVVLVNCVSYAAYIVLSRPIIRRLGPVTVVTWIFTWGALLFSPLGMPALAEGVTTWTPRGWAFVGYILLAPTLVAYVLNAWAIGRSSASLVTVYIYVQPLITAALAWVQLGQVPTSRMLWAAALIVLGVATVAARPRVPAASPVSTPAR